MGRSLWSQLTLPWGTGQAELTNDTPDPTDLRIEVPSDVDGLIDGRFDTVRGRGVVVELTDAVGGFRRNGTSGAGEGKEGGDNEGSVAHGGSLRVDDGSNRDEVWNGERLGLGPVNVLRCGRIVEARIDNAAATYIIHLPLHCAINISLFGTDQFNAHNLVRHLCRNDALLVRANIRHGRQKLKGGPGMCTCRHDVNSISRCGGSVCIGAMGRAERLLWREHILKYIATESTNDVRGPSSGASTLTLRDVVQKEIEQLFRDHLERLSRWRVRAHPTLYQLAASLLLLIIRWTDLADIAQPKPWNRSFKARTYR